MNVSHTSYAVVTEDHSFSDSEVCSHMVRYVQEDGRPVTTYSGLSITT